jgi:ribosomal protein S12 methylthiotransferase accessory factor
VEKVFFSGTHRVRPPEETYALIRPLLGAYGITRLADVTGLDDIGIPVVMAVRPLALTLSVSQGKGATMEAARVSGAMEAIELWHAEHAVPRPQMTATAAAELGLPYPVTSLEQHAGSLLTAHTLLDWIQARSATDGSATLVPYQAVRVGRDVRTDWRIYLLTASSNGLASGNTRSEAIVHGLYEVIERDTISTLTVGTPGCREYVDPGSVDDPHCAGLIERIRAAGGWLEIMHLPNRFAVPCMVCYLWREDHGSALVSGSGAHSDASVALSRAMTEAVQSRLTHIAGSRDDINPVVYRAGAYARPTTTGEPLPWQEIADRYHRQFSTDDAEAAWLALRVAEVSGWDPVVVDLTWGPHARKEFAVVKTCAPGLAYTARHEIPRPDLELTP